MVVVVLKLVCIDHQAHIFHRNASAEAVAADAGVDTDIIM